ncbi:hypothetical protein CAPTEDRAFT_225018 [Capitella teleta]|uniref:RRM domain-containing protein n=1 Tax=Capitella teleta TaxID=283909 RepID=R7V912_CAPTE|nr:hypothetical protein CAPTEDRAFT_225018 [Capitella teleta]|eukprot:ELU12200.1 hypothetical protein CAPTEDRAFT_225018 [Capitella teleta]
MSRIIVKGLPKVIKEERLKNTFGVMGTITNCQLKYTTDGIFRRFAFVGYTKESEADAAIKHFNNTYIDTSKITVELANELTDAMKPRAWSKYSKDSSAYQRANKETIKEKKDAEKKERQKRRKEEKEQKRQEKLNALLADIQGDEGFDEFLQVNKSKSTKAFWGNDDAPSAAHQENMQQKKEKVDSGEEEEEDMEDEEMAPSSSSAGKPAPVDKKTAKMTDLEYLKSKMTGVEDEETEGSEEEEEEGREEKEEEKPEEFTYSIKMKGAPNTVKKNQIVAFFKPVELLDVVIPNSKSKSGKVVSVEVASEKDLNEALKKNKNCIGPKKIFLHKVIEKKAQQPKEQKPKLWEMRADNEECEDIAESGRLYVRNLAYCCKEDDLEQLFTKYGTLSEVHLPIDSFTKKVKGFAFVSFMFPEHAVKAFQELDGKSWMGRILHILPGKEKTEEQEDGNDESNFKKKKLKEQKASAGSSHNWNTLFLGANAVVDKMAEQFGTKKSDILGVDGTKESIGVRVALGETRIVAETRAFLIDNGVSLDAFSQPAAARSKTVILAKNLPANSTADELKEKFEKFGTLGRLLLPPSGLSAIIEFMEPTEARMAFRSLAYTKFNHLPLYLEWAPVDVFAGPAKTEEDKREEAETKEKNAKEDGEEKEGSEESTPREGCSVFVKNINFETQDDALHKLFSKCGRIISASVSKKKDIKNPGSMLSMGFGFVEYAKPESAQKALKTLQHSVLDAHRLELKLSHRMTAKQQIAQRKKTQVLGKASSKILVRNIPFEAKQDEVKQLFSVFGELKTARLPRKLAGSGQHRGFAFVDFLSKEDAQRAFDALCHSTHLYGRRLVLEWADPDESVDELRMKTASRYADSDSPHKKLKKASLMNELDVAADKMDM